MTDTAQPAATAGTLQFPCKACGAELSFHIGGGSLRCPYCGYEEPIPTRADQIVEHDLDQHALASHATGYGVALRSLHCETCGACWSVEPQVTSSNCPFCGAGQVRQRDAATPPGLRPESLIPFKVTREQVLDGFKRWLRRLWFRPAALRHLAVAGDVRGVYVPFWTFDAFTVSHWNADAGYYYYEDETYTATNSQGQSEVRTRQVRKVRWVPVFGRHDAYFDDVPVAASAGINRKHVAKILPFETQALINYQPQFLVGLTAEDQTIGLQQAWPEARDIMQARIQEACRRAVPGDTQRNLRVSTSYHNRTFKPCLLPIWVATYRYKGQVFHYLCNGQTGKVGGDAPISWAKVLVFIFSLLGIIGGLILLFALLH